MTPEPCPTTTVISASGGAGIFDAWGSATLAAVVSALVALLIVQLQRHADQERERTARQKAAFGDLATAVLRLRHITSPKVVADAQSEAIGKLAIWKMYCGSPDAEFVDAVASALALLFIQAESLWKPSPLANSEVVASLATEFVLRGTAWHRAPSERAKALDWMKAPTR